jgi:hypothetical protein
MGKKSPAPPPAPDYTTLAIKQGEANLAAAKQSAYMSNPNIYSPTGTQTVDWTKRATVDTDAYNKAMEAYQQRLFENPEFAGAEPTQEQFTTYIEQPTVTQTVSADALAALRAQELTQRRMSEAASGAAQGLGNLGIASAFDARNLPGLRYDLAGAGDILRGYPLLGMAGSLAQGAGGEIQGAPQQFFSPVAGYSIEGLPGQIGAGQQAQANVAAQGAQLPASAEMYGRAGGGPAAPTNLGQLDANQFYAQNAPGGQSFGTAFGGPGAGLFGFASGGPQGVQFGGLDLSGMQQILGGVGQFGQAQGGPAGLRLSGFDTSQLGQIAGAPTAGDFGFAGRGPAAAQIDQNLNLSGVGDVSRNVQEGRFGYARGDLATPELQRQLSTTNLAAMPVNAGMTAQQAILSRLSPQLQGERQQLQTQLINQGLRPGGEAYNAAMSAQMLKENDLITQAALQGISLDAQMRQQGLAEQQALGQFANQAAMQQFGLGAQGLGLYNEALTQNFQQALAAQGAQNQAQQQAFQQRLAAGQYGREAQLASFGMGQQAQQLANEAVQQNYQQALAAQQAQNQAQQQGFAQQLAGQQFGQQAALAGFETQQQAQQAQNAAIAQNTQLALQSGQFANEAQAQQFAQRVAAGEFGREAQMASFQTGQQAQEAINRAIAQNFAQGQSAQEAQNQAISQNFQQALQAQQAQNAALAQNYQQALGAGQFNREALLQQFGMGQQAQQLQNAAIAQNYERQLAATQAANQALQQIFGQNVNVQELQNQAAGQNFQQQLAAYQANLARQSQQAGQSQEAAQFYNQAQAQAYQQELARQAAANAAQQQRFGQQMDIQAAQNAALAQNQAQQQAASAFFNQAQQQQFQQNVAQQQFYNTAVQQALAQQAAIRSIPVNEISALLSGGQINVPQFQGYQGVTVAPAPIFQGGQAQDAAAMQRYGIAANQAASNMGGLFNLAGSLGSAALLAPSDRRLKSNIVRLGTHSLGIGIYAYDIFNERQLGVMADEVEQVKPEAVLTHPSGYKMVNYGAL